MRYQILLTPEEHGFGIIHVESNCYIGYADVRGAKYLVRDDQGDEIGVVNSINEAIAVLRDSYEKHPRRWQCYSATLYSKISDFGSLDVSKINWDSGSHIAVTTLCCVTESQRSSLRLRKHNVQPMLTCGIVRLGPSRSTTAFRGAPMRAVRGVLSKSA